MKNVLNRTLQIFCFIFHWNFFSFVPGFGPFKGTWDDFFAHIKAGKQLYGDQLDWMQDWDRNKLNGDFLFLKYEDLKVDIVAGIKNIASFLNIEITEEQVERLVKGVGIKEMSKNDNLYPKSLVVDGGKFVRSGLTGEWRKYFTKEQNDWFDNKFRQGYADLEIDTVYE